MKKSCISDDFFSLGGRYYDLGKSSVETILVPQAKEASKGKKKEKKNFLTK